LTPRTCILIQCTFAHIAQLLSLCELRHNKFRRLLFLADFLTFLELLPLWIAHQQCKYNKLGRKYNDNCFFKFIASYGKDYYSHRFIYHITLRCILIIDLIWFEFQICGMKVYLA
jgi:hypothetical protein